MDTATSSATLNICRAKCHTQPTRPGLRHTDPTVMTMARVGRNGLRSQVSCIDSPHRGALPRSSAGTASDPLQWRHGRRQGPGRSAPPGMRGRSALSRCRTWYIPTCLRPETATIRRRTATHKNALNAFLAARTLTPQQPRHVVSLWHRHVDSDLRTRKEGATG